MAQSTFLRDTVHELSECMAILLATDISNLNLTYLAEGAANIIYLIDSTDPLASAHCRCCVLRLRKDLLFTQSCTEVLDAFHTRIVPLFVANGQGLLVEQVLFRLSPSMVDRANNELEKMEKSGSRPATRTSTYHPDFNEESFGILMPNLLRDPTLYVIEFKPKWLVQSPSAPKNAIRCRTCALNAARRSTGKDRGKGDMGFCPFDLLSRDENVLIKALSNIYEPLSKPEHAELSQFAASFNTKVQPALRFLQKLQIEHNNVGFNHFREPYGQDFAVPMALRDCSVFLSVTSSASDSLQAIDIVDIKLADLDLKSSKGGKLQKWATMEEELISNGAYTNPFVANDHCSLGRDVDTSA